MTRAPLWIASLLVLAACAPTDAALKKLPPPITPTERYSVQVTPSPDEIMLGAHASGLSPTQINALRDFVGRWDAADRKPIVINTPEHGPPAAAVYRTAEAARDYLIDAGVPASDVQMGSYDAAGDGASDAPIRVRFIGYTAAAPQCGRHWGDLAKSGDNETYREFGCSVTANMAVQIADPEDLMHPRAMGPSDASRREVVLGKYREGSTTSTAKDTQANGAVSSTGQ